MLPRMRSNTTAGTSTPAYRSSLHSDDKHFETIIASDPSLLWRHRKKPQRAKGGIAVLASMMHHDSHVVRARMICNIE